MTAAALGDISRDLNIDASTAQITFSVYFLGLAFGPFPIAAISEMNGRRNIWIFSNAWFILWNSLCPVGNSKELMIAGRFLAATGACVGNTILAPVMADMYYAKDRGKSLAIAGLLPYLGPALGPILGGIVVQLMEWRFIFWIMSILNALITLLGALFIEESYTPVLLRRKAVVQDERPVDPSLSPWERIFWYDVFTRLAINLRRPVRILIQRPVIQVIALVLALNFGIYTLLLSSFAALWIENYGQSRLSSSLHYISFSIGAAISTQAGARFMDWTYRRLQERHGSGRPEFRVPFMIPGTLLTPIGLFWYGWSAERRLSWGMVDVGAAVFACGTFVLSQALLAYMLDEFGEYAASARAASGMLSQCLGFVFPIFAPQLYYSLGYGWGNSLLAFIFIALAFPLPLCIWLWGDKLRALGRKATAGGSLEASKL